LITSGKAITVQYVKKGINLLLTQRWFLHLKLSADKYLLLLHQECEVPE